MRGKRLGADYLRDILVHAEAAAAFVETMDFERFREDRKTVFAVVRALEVIGEAARQTPAAVRKRYTEVPWRKAIGMRNIVVHEYFGVDLEVVWRTVHADLPPLQRAVAQALEDLERGASHG